MKANEYPLSAGLDFYKVTMGNVILDKYPEAEVTFTFKNRNSERPLSQYVAPEVLQTRLDTIRNCGFTPEEVAYYAGLKAQDGEARFTEKYLDHIADMKLPQVHVSISPETKDLAIDTIGPWVDVSLWETVVMSEVNEIYNQNLVDNIPEDRFGNAFTTMHFWENGDQKLSDKITRLKQRPDIKFADFGTRRRFSASWHDHVIGRLANELPENFVGTSNPWFAYKYDLKPIGTFAHEMPMVYAGLADAADKNPLEGHRQMLQDWEQTYNGDLSIALTDTFGSEFFFNDLTPEQAERWNGLRHDSGDPIEFGERAIEFYRQNNVDPLKKTLVFSDGLNIDMIFKLADYFKGRVNILFGWGTSLMNDVGLKATNIVMKATRVNGVDTVKLSDDAGKHTGPQEQVDRYVRLTRERNELARHAIHETVELV